MLNARGIALFAERHMMPDKVRVIRVGGEDVLDPATGALVPAAPLIVYEGKAGLYPQQEKIRSRGRDGAWEEEIRAGYRLLLPLEAAELEDHDEVLVKEARDTQAVGRTYEVTTLGEVSSFPVLRTVWLEQRDRSAS
ncbi:DUF6093 family protein [Streptomyces sp. PCS3-D2]|uniref:DUF6093 family protein n=1 Tax=Streptomyces sp. PCS3-D2 TaxID=1460244 RepID=UPI00044BF161|nr:DUF6093 family protein [Streptomyces sp. PCS3-D2]WKV74159.1 DUF6093 family protein [Streptomyces sp. PCS3-D2]